MAEAHKVSSNCEFETLFLDFAMVTTATTSWYMPRLAHLAAFCPCQSPFRRNCRA